MNRLRPDRPFVDALAMRIATFPCEAIALAKRAVDPAGLTVREVLLEESICDLPGARSAIDSSSVLIAVKASSRRVDAFGTKTVSSTNDGSAPGSAPELEWPRGFTDLRPAAAA
jgi:hypothetical protein